MTFGIAIDAAAWHAHTTAFTERIHAAQAALIPVIKGDGYGLGQALLADEATRLGVHAIAVGTVHELGSVLTHFAGDVMVLEPVDPRDRPAMEGWAHVTASADDARIIRTVANSEGLDHLLDTHPRPRIVIEARSAMQRFGFEGPALREAWRWAAEAQADERLRVHGVTVHLPLAPTNSDLDEILQLADEVGEAHLHLLVSHVSLDQLEILRRHNPDLRFSVRVGTNLWLGRRDALKPFGTVLAVHRVERGKPVGYGRRPARTGGHVVVVSGGTAHGIGLSAPSPARNLRQRITSVGIGVLDAMGRAKSPFSLGGQDLWFVEPPHQHVSMLWLPSTATPPAVGTRLAANVRFTTTHADLVELHSL